MYADHDLVLRAMQPHENLLRQARNERLIRCLRSQQAQSKTAIRWMAALGGRLILVGQLLRSAAQPGVAKDTVQNCCDEMFMRKSV